MSVLAAELGVEPTVVAEALQVSGCCRPISLEAATEGTDTDAWLLGPGDEHLDVEARVHLRAMLEELGDRDRLILYRLFFQERTQAEVGAELGVTQAQVSRLLSRIIADLRRRADVQEAQDVA